MLKIFFKDKMRLGLPIVFSNLLHLVPAGHHSEFKFALTRINVNRAKLICGACMLLGSFLFIVDGHVLGARDMPGFHPLYLYTDALLAGLGAVIYFSFRTIRRFGKAPRRFESVLILLSSLAVMAWCGGVGALEFLTHHSITTLVIGALVLPCSLFLNGWTVATVYALNFLTFVAVKTVLQPEAFQFLTAHITLVSVYGFGWLLSRLFFMNKAKEFAQQQKILEKNARLAREIKERKAIERELEQRVSDRTRALSDLNDALKKEIFQRKQAQTKLDHAQKMEVIGTMASGIAHDLNNVLSGINTYPEALLMDLGPNDPLRRPLKTIRQAGQKAADIVQGMLTLARRGVPMNAMVDINGVVHDYLNSFQFKKLGETHPEVTVRTSLAKNCPRIMGSFIHLSTALMNMVTNAAEAMPAGGTVTIATRSDHLQSPMEGFKNVVRAKSVILEIVDTGIGIPKENQEKIFEPFFTNKPMGKSGTGLGMALVLGTVKDHGGHIEVKSRVDSGTRFTLYFPVRPESGETVCGKPDKEDTDNRQHAAALPDSRGSRETVLVVDDLKEQLDIAASILNRFNYNAQTVLGGEKAVAFMEKGGRPDLIILDMNMAPGISGLETFRRIQTIRPGQKAVIASGYLDEALVKEAADCGITAYVHKPYTIKEITAAVQKALAKP